MRTSIVALCAGCLLAVVSGSKILFDANPDVIQANLTDAMTMRCSLNDTVDVTGSPGSVVGKRDVSQTKENLQLVTSIVITRNNGDPVANIINGNARAQADLALMTVTGDTSGVMAEKGYLELKWQYPGTAQTGEYVCEVNAVDAQGHNVVFSTSVEIGESMPTIGELMARIADLQRNDLSTTTRLQQLMNTRDRVKNLISSNNDNNCRRKKHVEQGQLSFGPRSSWPKVQNLGRYDHWAKVLHQAFAKVYDVPPKVEVGVVALDHDNSGNIRYDVSVTSVDRAGFSVEVQTWANSNIYQLDISWLSVDQ